MSFVCIFIHAGHHTKFVLFLLDLYDFSSTRFLGPIIPHRIFCLLSQISWAMSSLFFSLLALFHAGNMTTVVPTLKAVREAIFVKDPLVTFSAAIWFGERIEHCLYRPHKQSATTSQKAKRAYAESCFFSKSLQAIIHHAWTNL